MKKALLFLAVVIVLAATAFGSYVLGARTQLNRLEVQLEAGQAMLWFNHLLRYREIEADLSKGCSAEALEKTRISIDQEMVLLSSFYQENPHTWLNKYISDRDPTLLAKLEGFKSKYGTSWREPQCQK